MKKSLLVLLLAVLLPSLLLGWLALHSAEEQQIVLERRTAELYQKETDELADTARALVSDMQRSFADALTTLLTDEKPAALAAHFTPTLRSRWQQSAIGFALASDGRILSPAARDADPKSQQFLSDNAGFLGNKTAEIAYPVNVEEINRSDYAKAKTTSNTAQMKGQNTFANSKLSLSLKNAPEPQNANQGQQVYVENSQQLQGVQQARNIVPQQSATPPESQLAWATAEFREFAAEGNEGVINRFVQNRLNMIFWVKPQAAGGLIFGCVLRSEDLAPIWPKIFAETDASPRETSLSRTGYGDPEFLLALLDDKAKPVLTKPPNSQVPDWKKPFVATEIGEVLPHWEAALYLRHPEQLRESARAIRRNLYLLITCALFAIAAGGAVVLRDTNRQLILAQKKTDFVSNVSHELKTPLTSIRMFAEMMQTGRAAPDRVPQYLRIIMVEAERLTRLINNVLDFARLERGQRRLEMKPLDFCETLERLWPAQELHLQEAGFTAKWERADGPYRIVGDEDALAQVLVNLISNAEKYGGDRKDVTLHSYIDSASLCVAVLDRGSGVPAGEERKIFEPFYRAHDSLASGIPGTGLGLSLAARVVAEHGGEIRYAAREGGGSSFTLRLPIVTS